MITWEVAANAGSFLSSRTLLKMSATAYNKKSSQFTHSHALYHTICSLFEYHLIPHQTDHCSHQGCEYGMNIILYCVNNIQSCLICTCAPIYSVHYTCTHSATTSTNLTAVFKSRGGIGFAPLSEGVKAAFKSCDIFRTNLL